MELLEVELFLNLNCVLKLNWIVWNGTTFVRKSELFEIELIFEIENVYLC